jgi:hypothetical protein
MKNLLKSLSVVVLLTSACAKNSNQAKDGSGLNPNNTVLKSDVDSLMGSYTVEKFIAKTIDGDFQVTFPGLVETREVARDANGSLILKQKSSLNGCTREIVSPLVLNLDLNSYSRSKFTQEVCTGTCPAPVTGYFQGYTLQDPSFELSCGKNEDSDESGKVKIENNRLVFEVTNEYGFEEHLLKNN